MTPVVGQRVEWAITPKVTHDGTVLSVSADGGVVVRCESGIVWKWNKEDIALDADLNISITPKENMTRGERVQRALQLMNLALPLPETDRGELIKMVAREMGFREDDIRAIVKTDAEVKMEQQQQAMGAQLATAPQPSAGAPPGLNIRPVPHT